MSERPSESDADDATPEAPVGEAGSTGPIAPVDDDGPGDHPEAEAESSTADGESRETPSVATVPEQFDASVDLLGSVIDQTDAARERNVSGLDRFLAERSFGRALAMWVLPRMEGSPPPVPRKADAIRILSRDIAHIDQLLGGQVNAILHHPRFQRLEAAWCGLRYLVSKIDPDEEPRVSVRILNLSWKELSHDVTRAIEFDQSQLFGKIYSQEFGTAGGEPYGVLLADFEVRHRVGPGHKIDDLETLAGMSHVAAAAFAPFVIGAHPSFLGIEEFSMLERPLNLPRTFEQLEYLRWKSLRDSEDARFVGLTMPRILLRLPYDDNNTRVDGFRFREEVEGPDRSKYLWGPAVWAFGAVLARAFVQCAWLADIRGVTRDVEDGGLVTGLPLPWFSTDSPGVAPKFSCDAIITDLREKELADLGFVPLCVCKDTPFSAFYSAQSIQKPKTYDQPAATVNARISAMLQYMLCVARFAHYVKVLGRDRVGSFAEADEFERFVHRWLQRYVTSDDSASTNVKAQYPLREAHVEMRETPGKPGSYMSVVHLRPHFQLDEMVASVKLVTEVAGASG